MCQCVLCVGVTGQQAAFLQVVIQRPMLFLPWEYTVPWGLGDLSASSQWKGKETRGGTMSSLKPQAGPETTASSCLHPFSNATGKCSPGGVTASS